MGRSQSGVGAESDASATGVIGRDTISTVSSEGAHNSWRRLLSVQGVVALLCLMGITLSALSVKLLGESSCDDALAKTRDTLDTTTDDLSSSAATSLDEVTTQVLQYSASGVLEVLEAFLAGALQTMDHAIAVTARNSFTLDKTSVAWKNSLSSDLWAICSTLRFTHPVSAIGIYSNAHGVVIAGDPRLPELRKGIHSVIAMHFSPPLPDGTPASFVAPAVPYSGVPYLADPKYVLPIHQSLASLPGVGLSRDGLIGMNESRFPNVVPMSDFVGYAFISRQPDPITGGQLDVICFVTLEGVQNFLGKLTSAVEGDSVYRLFTVVASSWVSERMRELGHAGWEEADQRGFLTGVSHGSSMGRPKNGTSAIGGFPTIIHEPLKDVEATDVYIRKIAVAVGGRYAAYLDVFRTVQLDINGTSEAHRVGVVRMRKAEVGLDWWIVISLDEATIFGKVQKDQMGLRQKIKIRSEAVEDDINRARFELKFIVVGVGIALVSLSIITSYYVLRPLTVMQLQMNRVASMDLALPSEDPLWLYELHCMQRNFRKMVENLTEFRAYVPSAVLESNGYSGAGGKDVVEPPTGNVAIVFTDIKGSTELWKSSAGDMNAAMEIHNEVMRDACKDFDGYEVKTIGDAFMVSFNDPASALGFALAVQSRLMKRKWPPALELPEAGMVVRIGINYGPTIAEENPVTGRVDYRGSTVNLASRVEAKAKGGTICLTSDMYSAVRGHLDQLDNPAIHNHGLHDIKGLGNGHQLYLMAPSHLSKRFSDTASDCIGGMHPRRVACPMPTLPSPRGSRSDDHSGSTATTVRRSSGPTQAGGKKTALQVIRSTVTVAVCRLQEVRSDGDMFDNCNIMVRSALEAAHATDGVIGNVTGRTLTVVWNASKKCTMHSTAALNFVSEMKKLQGIMQVGLATGTMLHGNVGTKTSRFATAFGTPLEAAEAMTDHASMFGVYCLYADCTADKRLQADVTVRSCLRLVDAWKEEGKDRVLHIYEVHLRNLAQAMQGWGGPHPEKSRLDTDLDMQTRAVEAALQDPEGADALRSIVKEEGDEVLLRVLRMFDVTRPRDGYRCTVRFSKVPGGAVWQPRVQSAF